MTQSIPIRIGILGTGRMAATMTLAFSRQPGLQAVAVGSSSADRARVFAARFGVARSHGDLANFCDDPEIDIVYIANASRSHAETSCAALNAGKAVLCEKPFALSPEEGERVAEAARTSGRFFMETFWTLCLPAYRRLAELAVGGLLGTPQHLAFDFGYPVHADDKVRLLAPADGGVLFDRAGYGVALALRLLGPGQGALLSDCRAATQLVHIRHDGGGTSQIAVSAQALLSNRVTLGCGTGAAGLDPPSIGAESLWQTNLIPAPMTAQGGTGLRQRLRGLPALRRLNAAKSRAAREWLPYGAGPYDPMLAHVVARLQAGATGSDLVPLSLSLATLGILSGAAPLAAEGGA